jgi:antitoxin HicB
MTRHYQVLLEWDEEEGVWVTYVPALDYLSTYGETRQQALDNTQEAIQGYIEAAQKEGIQIPSGNLVTEIVELEVAV